MSVYLECIDEGGRLRVRITSPGYNNSANCQFPRAIRKNGAKYKVPPSAISFGSGANGKFFYRVKAAQVEVISETSIPLKVDNVYETEGDCVVCMGEPHGVILVPCGHYCLCKDCAEQIMKSTGTCPMCRSKFTAMATPDQLQT